MKKFFFIFVLMVTLNIVSYSSPFSDVPEQHWAYSAINELINKGYMGGYPDGEFKGESPLTRYEMAVTVAKILDRVRDVQSAGGFIDAREAATIRKLATEFKDELSALGIRIGNLEDRVKKLEDSQDKLSDEQNKFKIYGSYYSNFKYTIRDEVGDGSDTGFSDPYHEVTLEMISKPSSQSEFYMKMQNGMTDIGQGVEFSGDYVEEVVSTYEVSVPGGGTVEVSDTVKYNKDIDFDDQNSLKIGSLHYKLKAPRANMRFFFKEGFSSLDDSVGILNNPWHSNVYYDKGSGIEMDGNLNKDTSYFASVFQLHKSGYASKNTLLSLRPRYKVPENIFSEGSLTIGGFYVQAFFDSDTDKVKYTSLRGMDFEYVKNGKYNFTSTLTLMKNESNNESADLEDNESSSGMKLEASYKKGNLSSNLTFYNFEPDFGLYFSPDYYYAYRNRDFSGRDEWYYKWGDAYKYGERFFEVKNSYDLDFGNGQSAYVKMNYLKLWWDKDDGTDSWYNYDANKFNLDIYGEFSNKFKVDILNTIIKDPAKDEEGFYKTELKFYATVNPENSTKLELGVWAEKDNDKKNKEDSSERSNGIWGNVGWNSTDTIYMKTGFSYSMYSIGWDNINSDGDVEYKKYNMFLENTIDFSDNLVMENAFYYGKQGKTEEGMDDKRFIKTVFSNTFTSRLKGRFGYWWKQNTDQSEDQHVYADINYKAEDGTKLQFWYSPPYDNGDSSFDTASYSDSGPETFKQFKLTISTNF